MSRVLILIVFGTSEMSRVFASDLLGPYIPFEPVTILEYLS